MVVSAIILHWHMHLSALQTHTYKHTTNDNIHILKQLIHIQPVAGYVFCLSSVFTGIFYVRYALMQLDLIYLLIKIH